MRQLLFFLFIFATGDVLAQKGIVGCYGRQDSQIKLESDSTFFFFHAVDTYRGWIRGTWKVNRKQIVLTPILIYDTLTVKKDNQLPLDSLILSRDYTADRIVESKNKVYYIFKYEQNERLCPRRLQIAGNRLFVVKNSRRQKEKIKNGYYKESFDPWFTLNECKY